ncbi:MAG: hypothetical protein SGJ10_13085 [Bacteroidota bacterium]|nr:hypothetical protein [Bacteroidota bacterium]
MRKIKHKVLVLAAMFAANTFSFAQSYTIRPNDTFIVNAMMEDLETLTIQQVNSTSNTIYLKWEKISASVPALWEASVCDNQICYTTLVDSGSMNPIIPSEYGFLLLHITAHVNYGTAIIRYAVWDINFPLMKDTLTFIMNVATTGIANANFEAPSVWFAENKIHLQNTNENYSLLLISDLSGKEIFKTNIHRQTEIGPIAIGMPSLPTSVYIIQLSGKQKKFQQKIFITLH